MSRQTARENAYKLVYAFCITGEPDELSAETLLKDASEADAAFCRDTVNGVIAEYGFLLSVIARYSKDFSIDRVYKADLSALLIAVREILFIEDIPEKVSVNEALELVKKYSYVSNHSFVNGILASVIKNKEKLLRERENN